jgi:replication factor A1
MIILSMDVVESMGIADGKVGSPVSIEQVRTTTNPAETTIKGNDFYGVKEEPTTQPKQMMPTRPAATPGDPIYPIESLSFVLNKWKIRARVTYKSEIKRWHKANSEGKLFSVHLLDETGEIKATGFNDQVDQFYDTLQEGSVYYISSPCKTNTAKKQFNNLPHEFELTFTQETTIVKAEDQSSVPQVKFNFCTIEQLQSVEKDNTVDIIGVLKEVGDTTPINAKDGRSFSKRDLTLVDETGFSVRLTVWGKTAENFEVQPESVVAFKGAKVSDFDGKSLSLLSSGTMSVHPDIPDAHRLQGWYESAGRGGNFQSHRNAGMGNASGRSNPVKTVAEVNALDVNMLSDDGSPVYYSLKASILFCKQETFAYASCPNCRKKIVENTDGTWFCEMDQKSFDKPEYRYIMSLSVADHSGQQWISVFDEVGKVVLGMSANELTELRDNDGDAFTAVFQEVLYKKFTFKCRAKKDTYQDVPKSVYPRIVISPRRPTVY